MKPKYLWRMAVCAVLPGRTLLRRRLADGTVLAGLNKKGYGGRGVFVYGDEIEPEFAVFDQLLAPGDVLIDVGANTGIYTLKGARIVGQTGVVISLEPNPELLSTLHGSVRRNGYNNVRLRGIGASDAAGQLSFYENHGHPHSFSLVQRDDCPDYFSILTVDLDSLVEWEGLPRVDFIKIDAEGAEDRVVAGAQRIITAYQPAILAEVSRDGVHGLAGLPAGYAAYAAPGGPNQLLLPAGHRLHATMPALGWPPV